MTTDTIAPSVNLFIASSSLLFRSYQLHGIDFVVTRDHIRRQRNSDVIRLVRRLREIEDEVVQTSRWIGPGPKRVRLPLLVVEINLGDGARTVTFPDANGISKHWLRILQV